MMLDRSQLKRLWNEFVNLSDFSCPTQKSERLSDELNAIILEEGNKKGFIPVQETLGTIVFIEDETYYSLGDGRGVRMGDDFEKSVFDPLNAQIYEEKEKGRKISASKYEEHKNEVLDIALYIIETGSIVSQEEKAIISEYPSYFYDYVFTIDEINYAVNDFPSIFERGINGEFKDLRTEYNEIRICDRDELPLFVGQTRTKAGLKALEERLKEKNT